MSDQSPPQHGAPGPLPGWPAPATPDQAVPGPAAPGPYGAPAGHGGYGGYGGYGAPGPQGPYGPPQTPGPPMGMPWGWPVRPPRNKPGKASMILGIVAAAVGITVVGSLFGISLGLLAVFFGIVGRRRARRGGASNPGQALAGLITGACAIVLSAVLLVVLVTRLQGDLPGTGDVALTSTRGAADAPLAARTTATYDDGTWVTVGPARRFDPPAGSHGHTPADAAYAIDVTVAETGGRSLPLDDYRWLAEAVQPDGTRKKLGLISAPTGPLSRDFPARVASGDRVTVEFAFDVPGSAGDLRFGFRPGADFASAYWRLPLGG